MILRLWNVRAEGIICPMVRDIYHLVLLLQLGDPHPNVAHLRISLKQLPLPHMLQKLCIRYKDVEQCLLETGITIPVFV